MGTEKKNTRVIVVRFLEVVLALVIVVCITIIQLEALKQKLDGQIFFSTLSTLLLIFGYFLGKKRAYK